MTTSDPWIMRLVALTICLCAVMLVGVVGYSALGKYEIDEVLDRLAFLVLGGLLTAFSTKLTGKESVEVKTAPGEVVRTDPVGD